MNSDLGHGFFLNHIATYYLGTIRVTEFFPDLCGATPDQFCSAPDYCWHDLPRAMDGAMDGIQIPKRSIYIYLSIYLSIYIYIYQLCNQDSENPTSAWPEDCY